MKYENITLDELFKFQNLLEFACDGNKKEISVIPTENFYQLIDTICNALVTTIGAMCEVVKEISQMNNEVLKAIISDEKDGE